MKNKWRGQGLVEFALILPVLLMVVLGIIEASLVVQGYVTVQHAAREAARFAVTYQPIQGACLDQDRDGQIEDGIRHDADDRAPYPACPIDGWGNPSETDEDYYERRAKLIKQRALDAATGLRIDRTHLGDTPSNFEANKGEPRFFGVLLWGYPSFLVDCNDPSERDQCVDHPGLEGLPVRVLVRHNVQVVDPLYRVVAEYVPVQADAQMVNEGVQVGFGDVPPPDFDTVPDVGETPVPTNTRDPDEETPEEPTDVPRVYSVQLNLEHAVNQMPEDREHEFIATVTDEGQGVQGARVSFSLDMGGFGSSGTEPRYVEKLTNAQGRASVTLYGNETMTATLRAWLDYDGDDVWDGGEPSDEATKAWYFPPGPYITVSSHQVVPFDYVYVNLMDHDAGDYALHWCVISGTETSEVVQDPVTVDAGDDETVGFQIPVGSDGEYRFETHDGGGSCGESSDLVAISALVEVVSVPPDLHITGISWPESYGDELPSGTDITFTLTISNSSPTPVQNTYFDVDFYLDPQSPPPFRGQMGNPKQWLLDIDAYGEQEVHATFNLGGGTHQMWGQVDTTDYVKDEYDESNNVGGPYTLTVRCTVDSTPYGDDFNDLSVDGKWTSTGIPSGVSGSVSENSDGHMRIRAYGSSTWGSSDNMYYVYQSLSGDFDARLRVWSVPQCGSFAKAGLMVRNSTASNSRYVMMAQTRSNGVQCSYRPEDGADAARAANDRWVSSHPWVRIVRNGDTFDYYYSTASDPGTDDWTYRTSITVDMDDEVLLGIGHASYGNCSSRNSEMDEFVVCQPSSGGGEVNPPGMKECQQLLQKGGFEGNPDRVFEHWRAGEPLAFQHQSTYFYEGTMSMRLHAALGSYPVCPVLRPWLYQTVEIPASVGDVYTLTTLHVRGKRLVAESNSDCCTDVIDPDDVLHLQMQDGGGGDLGEVKSLASGASAPGVWESFEQDVTTDVDLETYAGQDVRVHFEATQDETDYDCTFFYLDDLECEVCTEWPVPPEEPGTASVGGEVRVLVSGIPQTLQGVEVWAYSPGGQSYHTATIQDGTYHFYNVPPGSYTIYAEVWVGGGLRFATTTVVLSADERNYSVNLFLL